MAPKQEGPRFEPTKQWYEHLVDLFSHLFAAVRSAHHLVEAVKEMDPADRKTLGVGAVGALGLGGTVAVALTDKIDVAFAFYVIVAVLFQVPWIYRALPVAIADSERRKQLHQGRREEEEGAERYDKTRRWRHRRASSLVGQLRSPLEQCRGVAELMEATVEKVEELTEHAFALVMVRRKGRGLFEIVLTQGEVSDCFKTGTTWSSRDMDVYEYVERRSLYPSHMIEREVLGKDEYFLIAASEIDVVGSAKECVLDCFLDIVDQGIGRVVAHGGA